MTTPTQVGARLREFVRRHRRDEEAAVEAVGINLAWRLFAGVLASSIASAAITAAVTEHAATYHPSFVLSTKGAAFVARNEGLRLTPYNDPFNCTVGVGHLIHYGRCTSNDYARWRITSRQAMTLLAHDAGWASNCVRARITHRIVQPQFDALVDLSFNAGCGSLDYSGIANEINRGAFAVVPGTLSRTAVTANGVYLAGLRTRRLAEATLFAHGYYGAGIGSFVAKPNPNVQPKPLPAWAWRWAAWRLGHKPYRGHRLALRYRPRTAPRHIPAWAWRWFHHTFKETRR